MNMSGQNEYHDGIKERLHGIFGARIPWCNLTIVCLNIIIFFVTDIFLFSSADALVAWGGLSWLPVQEGGETYRLITSMFMHGSIQHLGGNMLVLLYLGSTLEQQIGSLHYLILYLGSGILAGCVSMGYNKMLCDYTVSIGASGAIFGVMGAMLFMVLFLRERFGGYNARQMAVMVFFGLYGGFASPGVDNAAHVGGLIAGFVLGALLSMLQFKQRH